MSAGTMTVWCLGVGAHPLHHFVVPLPRYAGEELRLRPAGILPRSRGRGTTKWWRGGQWRLS
jgi:hypothetical protein